jgi:hypothetical protein
MRFAIRHETRFDYATQIQFARCNVRLRPIAWPGQLLERFSLIAEPGGMFMPAPGDRQLANVDRLVVEQPVRSLAVIAEADMIMDRLVPIALPDDPDTVTLSRLARESVDVSSLGPAGFIFPSALIPLSDDITRWCSETMNMGGGAFALALELARRIQREFAYVPGVTNAMTQPTEAFARRHGVCQDFAQIMIAGLRGLGLPAAYASGYLRTIPPPGQARLTGADATHAWVMLWCGPERGWIGFDPTNGITMASDHVLIAMGRDYADVAPIDGIFTGAGPQNLRVAVDVVPVD